MKTRNLLSLGVAAALATTAAVRAAEENEGEIKSSDVPAAVQKAAETAAKGRKIIRWEKERGNYEAVVENKKGKQVGIELNADGKVVGKHDEAKEHAEKK